jgi:hypothetical protein
MQLLHLLLSGLQAKQLSNLVVHTFFGFIINLTHSCLTILQFYKVFVKNEY